MEKNYFKTQLLFAFLGASLLITSCKKEGCTNPEATNYEASAKKDDGSCILPIKEEPNTPPSKVVFDDAPENQETEVNFPLTISWLAANDSDGDIITYDVFLGTDENNPDLVSENQSGLSFQTVELELGTTYFLRVDSKAGTHTTSGETRTFTTTKFGSYTDSRDSQIYGTVKIGDQIWMTSNLVYISSGSYSYDNTASNDVNYGRLYEWAAVSNAIPSGWHLPTDGEWKILETQLGMPVGHLNINAYGTSRGTDQGTQLKQGGSSGLNFPLAGFRSGGTYSALNNRTYLWVNTDAGGGNIFRRRLVIADPSCYRFTNPAGDFAISVRLVKD
ncbi:MAG: FISUMP domain-containing protein [Crocinitomicaceae bacterium]